MPFQYLPSHCSTKVEIDPGAMNLLTIHIDPHITATDDAFICMQYHPIQCTTLPGIPFTLPPIELYQ